jgi:hypothetical protein
MEAEGGLLFFPPVWNPTAENRTKVCSVLVQIIFFYGIIFNDTGWKERLIS